MKKHALLWILGLLLVSLAPAFAADPSTVTATAAAGDPILGRWKLGKGIIVFFPDGKFNNNAPNYHEHGTWKCVSKAAPPKYELNWSDGRRVQEFHLSEDKLKRHTKNGWEVAGTRVTE